MLIFTFSSLFLYLSGSPTPLYFAYFSVLHCQALRLQLCLQIISELINALSDLQQYLFLFPFLQSLLREHRYTPIWAIGIFIDEPPAVQWMGCLIQWRYTFINSACWHCLLSVVLEVHCCFVCRSSFLLLVHPQLLYFPCQLHYLLSAIIAYYCIGSLKACFANLLGRFGLGFWWSYRLRAFCSMVSNGKRRKRRRWRILLPFVLFAHLTSLQNNNHKIIIEVSNAITASIPCFLSYTGIHHLHCLNHLYCKKERSTIKLLL